jgi:hypothetical protein
MKFLIFGRQERRVSNQCHSAERPIRKWQTSFSPFISEQMNGSFTSCRQTRINPVVSHLPVMHQQGLTPEQRGSEKSSFLDLKSCKTTAWTAEHCAF